MDDCYWDADDVGRFLKVAPRYVKERLAPHPDFPKASRMTLAGGGRGNARWKPEVIREWMERQ